MLELTFPMGEFWFSSTYVFKMIVAIFLVTVLSITDIVNYAKSAGFIVQGQVDLLQCAYEYQYLYIFQKPASF